MYHFLQKFHSGLAYIALLLLLIAVINALIGVFSKKEFTSKDRKVSLFGMLTTHIMLLVGLILYFVSPIGFAVLGEIKNASLRLTSLEHPLTNIIAITLITIGWSRHKKAISSDKKFKSISVFFGIGLILILSRIPWSLWF